MDILQRLNTLLSMYRVKEPDNLHLPKQEYEWSRIVYGNAKEEIPKDTPRPLGKKGNNHHIFRFQPTP